MASPARAVAQRTSCSRRSTIAGSAGASMTFASSHQKLDPSSKTRLSAWTSGCLPCAGSQLQERCQFLRDSPGSRRHSENRLVYGSPNPRRARHGELRVPLSDSLHAQFYPDPPEIVFGEPISHATPIGGTTGAFEVRVTGLRPIYNFVRDEVIPRFAGFFK
jgi:hypothetical protein